MRAVSAAGVFVCLTCCCALHACRLLSSFHTTVAEITIIATPDSEVEPGQASKTVQMRSFNDPAKGDYLALWSFYGEGQRQFPGQGMWGRGGGDGTTPYGTCMQTCKGRSIVAVTHFSHSCCGAPEAACTPECLDSMVVFCHMLSHRLSVTLPGVVEQAC